MVNSSTFNLTLRAAKRLIGRWSLPQQRRLLAWLRAEVEAADVAIEKNWSPPSAGSAVEQQRQGKSVFLLQGVKCGKSGCKCAAGDLHGPYWYEYWREGSKVCKKYHGLKIRVSKT